MKTVSIRLAVDDLESETAAIYIVKIQRFILYVLQNLTRVKLSIY